MTESFLFYPAERFDIAGKQILTGNKKYYMADLGIRNHILPRKKYDLGFSIENVVFFELLPGEATRLQSANIRIRKLILWWKNREPSLISKLQQK